MDLDDSAEKVRRNVVVFSSVIFAVLYLQIPLQKMSIFGIVVGDISSKRIWILFLLVSCYLLWRYHFDKATREQLYAARLDFMRGYYRQVGECVLKDIVSYCLRKKPAKIINPDSNGHIRRAFASQNTTNVLGNIEVHTDSELQVIGLMDGQNGLSVSLFEFTTGNNTGDLTTDTGPVTYDLPKLLMFRLCVVAGVRFVIATKSGVDLFVPYTMGVLAVLTCGLQLIPRPW